jgi:hypothetical protein
MHIDGKTLRQLTESADRITESVTAPREYRLKKIQANRRLIVKLGTAAQKVEDTAARREITQTLSSADTYNRRLGTPEFLKYGPAYWVNFEGIYVGRELERIKGLLKHHGVVVESVDADAVPLTEGYEAKIIGYLRDAGFARDEAQFKDGVLHVAKKNLVAKAETVLRKHKDIHELPKIVFKFHESREWNIKHGTSMKDAVDEMGRSGWKPVGKIPSGNFSGNISFKKGKSKAHLVVKGGNPEKWVYESVEEEVDQLVESTQTIRLVKRMGSQTLYLYDGNYYIVSTSSIAEETKIFRGDSNGKPTSYKELWSERPPVDHEYAIKDYISHKFKQPNVAVSKA